MKSNKDLMLALGGSLSVAYHLNVHQYTVGKWARTRIPEKYWPKLVELSNGRVTLQQIQKLNRK